MFGKLPKKNKNIIALKILWVKKGPGLSECFTERQLSNPITLICDLWSYVVTCRLEKMAKTEGKWRKTIFV